MLRRVALGLAVTAFAAAACGEARAEDIQGHVYGPPDFETGVRSPIPGKFLFLQRMDVAVPEDVFQAATVSGPDGSYEFSGLLPLHTYKISVVGGPLDVACPFTMMYFPPGSPPEFTGMPLPTGLTLPPGPPSNVDLNAPPGCGLSSPCAVNSLNPGVVGIGGLTLSSPTVSWAPVQIFDHGSRCWDPPYNGLGRNADVTMEWLESSVERSPVTARFVMTMFGDVASHADFTAFEDAPLLPGDRVRVYLDLDQPALESVMPVGPTSFEFTYDEDSPIPSLEVHFVPVYEVSGRAFVEHGTPNGVFDGSDGGLAGLTVMMFDDFRSPSPAPPVAQTTTDAEGRYRFLDMPEAYYRIVLVTPGPAADPDTVRLVSGANAFPADFAFTEANCPHLPRESGDVHEVTFDARVFVGDVDPLVPVVVDSVDLLDGCNGVGHADSGCSHDDDGFLFVESVGVSEGWATVRVRLTAEGAAFPAGFFGDVDRRLVVSVNGHACSACVRFACESLQPGTTVPLAPWPEEETVDETPCGELTVVDLWGWAPWRECIPTGPCVDASSTLDGGVNSTEFELDLPASQGKSQRKGHVLEASLDEGGLLDRVKVRFDGDSTSGEAAGNRGRLVVERARLEGDTWRVRVRITALDRADGNPGSLPCGARLDVRVDDASSRTDLDFEAVPFAAGLLSLEWLNAIDAACRYAGR